MRYVCCLLLSITFGVHAADAPPKRYFPDTPRLAVLFQEDPGPIGFGFPFFKRTYTGNQRARRSAPPENPSATWLAVKFAPRQRLLLFRDHFPPRPDQRPLPYGLLARLDRCDARSETEIPL